MPKHGATAGLCAMCAAGVRAMKTVQTSIESLCSELCGIGSLDGHAFREGAEHGAVSAIASGLVRRFGIVVVHMRRASYIGSQDVGKQRSMTPPGAVCITIITVAMLIAAKMLGL